MICVLQKAAASRFTSAIRGFDAARPIVFSIRTSQCAGTAFPIMGHGLFGCTSGDSRLQVAE
jgi:hypothetical protein